ncbi:MAG: LarC family nickel insertion protein, partial [Planctomycetota bacterium]
MKIAYLDCASGISGDMTLGAMVDAGVDLEAIQAGVDSLAWPAGTPNCRFATRQVKKCGFRATQVTVEHEPEHAHRHLHHITAMIEGSRLPPRQKELATAIFTKVGEAEALAHGTTIEKVHFHEVGAVDSIADIVGAAIGWDLLGVGRVEASPIPTGTGFVQIAHGRCAIPAPATAQLLRGVPLADFAPEGELTTPTGAAIAATVVDAFGPLPAMTIQDIGYGAGQKDFDHPN